MLILVLLKNELAFSYFEEKPAVLVHDDDVAGPEVDVAFLQRVPKKFLLVVVRIVHVCLKSMTSSLVEVYRYIQMHLAYFQAKYYVKRILRAYIASKVIKYTD